MRRTRRGPARCDSVQDRLHRDLEEEIAERFAHERQLSGHTLECHDRERLEIGAVIDDLRTSTLLGAHIEGRTEHRACLCVAVAEAPDAHLRDAEVEDLRDFDIIIAH
jgi:hypothetical protein